MTDEARHLDARLDRIERDLHESRATAAAILERLVAMQSASERDRDAAERDRETRDRRHAELAHKVDAHLSAHGIGRHGAESLSVWIAPQAMHLYHHRWRVAGLLVVLAAVLAPQLRPWISHLRGLVSP